MNSQIHAEPSQRLFYLKVESSESYFVKQHRFSFSSGFISSMNNISLNLSVRSSQNLLLPQCDLHSCSFLYFYSSKRIQIFA